MKIIVPLTTQRIKVSIQRNEAFPLRDGMVRGLQLDKLKASYRWRLRYSIGKKRSYYTLGEYPALTLSNARAKALKIKELIQDGKDPQMEKKRREEEIIRIQNKKSFHQIAMDFFEIKKKSISREKFKKSWLGTYTNYIYPLVGSKPVDDIGRSLIISVIKRVPKIKLSMDNTKNNKTYKAKEVLSVIRAIFRYAVDNGYLEHNPSLEISISSLLPKEIRHKRKAVIEIERLREIYQSIKSIDNQEIRYKLLFQALTALRTVGLYRLKWEYIDFNKRVIIYPVNTYKGNQEPFKLPLTNTLVEILEFMKILKCGDYVFIDSKTKEVSFSSLMSKHYRDLGINDHTPHGWRASFASISMEFIKEHSKGFLVIESQLAHKIGSRITQAYFRSNFLDERRELMRWWESLLENNQ